MGARAARNSHNGNARAESNHQPGWVFDHWYPDMSGMWAAVVAIDPPSSKRGLGALGVGGAMMKYSNIPSFDHSDTLGLGARAREGSCRAADERTPATQDLKP